MKRESLGLILWIGVCLGAGVLGAFFTAPSIPTWYAGLAKPAWTPPNWIFSPVWTFLYLTMGVSGWLIWEKNSFSGARNALMFFVIQLVLNAAWSILFFGLRNPLAGLVDIILMWFAILSTMIAFLKIDPIAGWILLPYLLWTTFAAALNFAIWRMN